MVVGWGSGGFSASFFAGYATALYYKLNYVYKKQQIAIIYNINFHSSKQYLMSSAPSPSPPSITRVKGHLGISGSMIMSFGTYTHPETGYLKCRHAFFGVCNFNRFLGFIHRIMFLTTGRVFFFTDF